MRSTAARLSATDKSHCGWVSALARPASLDSRLVGIVNTGRSANMPAAVALGSHTALKAAPPTTHPTLEAFKSDIRALDARASMIRAALGHPPADIEATLARFQMHGSDLAQARVAAQALAQLRDQKVAELQILGLHECGRSLNKRRRDKKDFSTSHKAFNLNALLSTVDALIDQHQLLQDKASEQEEVERQRVALEKENKALRAEAALFKQALEDKTVRQAPASRPVAPRIRSPRIRSQSTASTRRAG